MLLASSTQTAVGWVIAILVFIGFVAYVLANLRAAKPSLGSEIELAANRKPLYDDDELENDRLNKSLLFALSMLGVIGLGLPLYWLAEPARITNAEEGFEIRAVKRGTELYDVNCSRCHGPGATGGVLATSLTDDNGAFVAEVSWKAPALTSVLSKFSTEEVTYVLEYGRNGVMPAWGSLGGGPLTDNQLKDIIAYLRTVQLPEEEMRASVDGGIRDGARALVLDDRPNLQRDLDAANRSGDAAKVETATAAVDTAVDSYLAQISNPSSPLFGSVYGKLVFNNAASQGAYSCARCHTKGWSYDGEDVEDLTGKPLIDEYVDGSGFFGPSLLAGTTTRKFDTVGTHITFITDGSQVGKAYGNAGVGSGQMPGFGARLDDDAGTTYAAVLTDEQIAAVVAYERGMQ